MEMESRKPSKISDSSLFISTNSAANGERSTCGMSWLKCTNFGREGHTANNFSRRGEHRKQTLLPKGFNFGRSSIAENYVPLVAAQQSGKRRKLKQEKDIKTRTIFVS